MRVSPRRTAIARAKSKRGGKRPGAGRKKLGNVRITITVKKATHAKIERMKKATPLWKRSGEIIDEVVRTATFEGEKEIYRIAEGRG